MSLRELARRVGVSPSLVSQIELDRVNPSVSTLWALVTELGLTMSDVFGDASWVLVKPDASEPHFHVHAEAGSPEEAQRLIANFRQRIEKLSSDTYAR